MHPPDCVGPRYFDRKGREIALLDWATKLNNRNYARVAEATVAPGLVVSTVWLGLDHRMPGSATAHPLIFETQVFGEDGPSGRPFRTPTLRAAMRAHDQAVEELHAG